MEVTELPFLEKLHLDNNRLSLLPPELGDLKNLKVLSVDNNMLVSVPGTPTSLASYLYISSDPYVTE